MRLPQTVELPGVSNEAISKGYLQASTMRFTFSIDLDQQ